ncbi:MAG TPA: hypothetical protein VMZ52_20610 [Bryobacteraceae bacterium]|nr:hypothetical protein [Bryobacteraceae bacterium]
MGLRRVSRIVTGIAAFTSLAVAAPRLRLSTSAVGPISVAAGGTANARPVETYNVGDGVLNLRLASSAAWLKPSFGTQQDCLINSRCTPLQISVQPGTLARGTYTGIITVSDPAAIDSPQDITVTIQVGGGVPDRLDLFAAPNGPPVETKFTTNSELDWTVNGLPAVTLLLEGSGSFRFVYPYRITVNPRGLNEGSYNGTIVTSRSKLSSDNKSIPVALRVTSQPIGQLSQEQVRFRIAQNSVKQTEFVSVNNRGLGTLSISGATPITASGGNWLTAEKPLSFGGVAITADPSGMAPGTYQGSVAIASNAANTLTVPVQLEVLAPGPARTFYGGVGNNATYDPDDVIAQGGIVAAFGEQFTAAPPTSASKLPLTTELNGTRVFVNGQPAPIFYSSYKQVNFQIPFDAALGQGTVRVDREGQAGNLVSINIVRGAPRILLSGLKEYGIVLNEDQTYAMPVTPGVPSHPAKAGSALVIYALGLGPATPAVLSGEASPGAEPLARVSTTSRVFFGGGLFSDRNVEAKPFFVGLAPNFVGLYQINVIVPDSSPTGPEVTLKVGGDDGASNSVKIAIE